MTRPTIGAPAPDFDLPADDGSRVRLRDLRGKPVILYFYPRDETPGCTTEACAFRDARSMWQDAGAEVLGVSGDSVASHTKFRARHSLPFRLLSDPDHAVMGAYGAWGEKVMYGKHMVGVIRSTCLIDKHGRIAALWPKVKVAGHIDAVLQALAGLEAQTEETGHG